MLSRVKTLNNRKRWQLPKFTVGGRAYLTHYGSRIYMDEVMRTKSDTDDSIVGTQCICNFGGYVVRARENYGEEEFSVSIEMGD